LGGIALIGLASLSGVTVDPFRGKIHPVLMQAIEDTSKGIPGVQGILSLFTGPPTRTLLIRTTGDPSLSKKMADLGAETVEVTQGFIVGRMPVEVVRYISNWPSVTYMEPSRQLRKMLDLSRPAVLADVVQSGTGAGLQGVPYTGIGSLVGIVDTGLSASHRDFYDNGSLSSPRVTWFGFAGASAAGIDSGGHGTHVSGIAAGNGFSSRGTYTGMAPGARMLFYQTSFFDTDILAGLDKIFTTAGNAPVSVNLSLGGATGPHDGTSLFESAVNNFATGIAGSKRILAVAAGNEGDLKEHFHGVVTTLGGSTTFSVMVPVPSTGSPGPEPIDLWAAGTNLPGRQNEYDEYTVSVTGPGFTLTTLSGQTAISAGFLAVSNRVDTSVPNGATHITITPTNALVLGTLSITLTRTRAGGNGVIDGYIDIDPNQASAFSAGFSPATTEGKIIEPANGDNVVSVAAWVTRNTPDNWGAVGSIAAFSSSGPTRDGRQKPDIAAPGANIYSARSRDANFLPSEIVTSNDNYAIMSGTSMATPHVTGIAALIWQSNASLTGAQMRERIRRESDGVGTVPNTAWGYGKVNALKAITATVAAISAPSSVPTLSSVTVDGSNSSAAFFGNALAYNWSLLSKPAGSGATLGGSGVSAAFTPDIPGDYRVSLTAAQAVPAGTAPATITATIHANRLPTPPAISGPASSDNATPVPFSAVSSDPDGLPLTWNWMLVSKPSGSVASIVGSGANANLIPDLPGTYVVGVRSNDGTDNSFLAVATYQLVAPGTPLTPPTASGSSHGGCSIGSATASAESPDFSWLLAGSLILIRVMKRHHSC
jgi:subtilisin family serine protease